MPVHAIALNDVTAALNAGDPAQLRAWCAQLEAGGVLYFPQTPLPIPSADLSVLLGQQQTGSKLHKNIAYKPNRDELTGVDAKSASPQAVQQVHDIMRRYSGSVSQFLAAFLGPYNQRWVMDYASYRPLEEQGRDLALRKRNDLLHTDAFPTRPTKGWRILRFFHNIHPTRTRDWVVGEAFPAFVRQFTPNPIPMPRPDSSAARAFKSLAQGTGLAGLVPQWKRTPYDEFMMRLHNAMKENEAYQRDCKKEHFEFAPGSSWMVYTETVPHAVLAGQYALEQTFLVDPNAMVTPDSPPVRVLEKMAGARLV
ncbi:MAG: Kdo hydroxylase family protein [Acidobacteriota bacterium]